MYRPLSRNAHIKAFSWWFVKIVATTVLVVIVTAVTGFYVAKWAWLQVPEEKRQRIEVAVQVMTEVDLSELTEILQKWDKTLDERLKEE